MAFGGIRLKDIGTSGTSLAELIKIDSGAGAGATHDNIRCHKATTETFSVDVNGLEDTTSGDLYQYKTINIGDVAADSDAIVPFLWRPQAQVTLQSIGLTVDTDIVDDNVNYQTIQFKDAAGNNILSAGFTTDVTWTAGTIISAGALNVTHKILTADEDMKMTFTKTVAGKAMSGLCIHIAFKYTA